MPDISVLQELSRILEVSVDELLAGSMRKRARREQDNGKKKAGRRQAGQNGRKLVSL